MDNVYRNHTSAMGLIQMLGSVRISTTQEAVAMLRAMQPINAQIAAVLQRAGLREQQLINRSVQRTVQEVEQPVVEQTELPTAPVFTPEDLTTEEGYSEEEIEAKVAKLKSAKKVAKKK